MTLFREPQWGSSGSSSLGHSALIRQRATRVAALSPKSTRLYYKKKLGTGGIVPFVCSPCLDDASCMEGETCNYVVFPALTSRCIIIFRHHFFRLLDNLPDLKKNIPHTSNQSHYTTPELHANVKGFPPKTELKSSLHRDPAQSGLTFNEARIAIRRRF